MIHAPAASDQHYRRLEVERSQLLIVQGHADDDRGRLGSTESQSARAEGRL